MRRKSRGNLASASLIGPASGSGSGSILRSARAALRVIPSGPVGLGVSNFFAGAWACASLAAGVVGAAVVGAGAGAMGRVAAGRALGGTATAAATGAAARGAAWVAGAA